jgi:hypothetical protein
MSPTGSLELLEQEDGDIIVVVRDEHERGFGQSVEFCTFAGGGRSPQTLQALRKLAIAMQQDNEHSEQPSNCTRR